MTGPQAQPRLNRRTELWATHTGLKNFIARTKSALGRHTVDGRVRSFLETRHQNRLAPFLMSQLPWEGRD